MIWKGLMVVTGSESPIVVVLSGSMEPAFQRGDLLFLTNYEEEDIRVGEIVVFKIDGRDIPIVHRVLKLHEKEDGRSNSSQRETITVWTTGVSMLLGNFGWTERTWLVGQEASSLTWAS